MDCRDVHEIMTSLGKRDKRLQTWSNGVMEKNGYELQSKRLRLEAKHKMKNAK